MLILKGIEEVKKCNVQVDYYVPFTIEIGEQNNFIKENVTYWRTGDIEKSLIEIGIGAISGELKNITLTTVGDVSRSNITVPIVDIEEGIPSFEISEICDKGVYDFIHEFDVYLDYKKIIVMISDINECKKIAQFDRIKIGVNHKGQLNFISIDNLTDMEYADLKNSFDI